MTRFARSGVCEPIGWTCSADIEHRGTEHAEAPALEYDARTHRRRVNDRNAVVRTRRLAFQRALAGAVIAGREML